MALTIPTVPDLPAGHVVTAAELNACGAAVTFLLNKPVCRVHDGGTGATINNGTMTSIAWSAQDIDTDSMFAPTSTDIVIQTPGWYKVRYGVNCTGGTNLISTRVVSFTGPNNPQGSGIQSLAYWGGYCVISTTGAAGSSGLWPFYLYAGDILNVQAVTNNTGVTMVTTNAASFFAVEYVST